MVKIVADTTSCIPPDEAEQLGVYYLPQIIVFGEETYRDDSEMDPRTFLKRQKISAVLPKTAAPPPAMYTPIFAELSEKGDTIIVLCPSATVSGTFRGATVAAQDFPNADIRIIDTLLIAGGLGAVVKQALAWANEGIDADTIVTRVKEMCLRERIYFLVDTLEYLYKGGRIGAAKALFGSLLQMKPILTFRDGQIKPFDSQRTHKRAIAKLKEIVMEDCPREPAAHISIMHGDSEDIARQCAEDLGAQLGIPIHEIPIYDLTPAILVHSGPGVIAISYFVQPGQ
jgi:DegV family protein with EDD domain